MGPREGGVDLLAHALDGAAEEVNDLAMALLRAVDEGAPSGVAARALALAALATARPGSTRWTAAVEILEGGPLRVRRAVMLAGEVLEAASFSERVP